MVTPFPTGNCLVNPLCDTPSGCGSFTGPWTVTHSSLRMLRRVAAFCRPLRPVLPLVSLPRSRSPVVLLSDPQRGIVWSPDQHPPTDRPISESFSSGKHDF